MKNLLCSFYSLLPSDLKDLVISLNQQDIRVGFIGGVTRDFLLYNVISTDVDLELRSISEIDMKKLCEYLGGKLNTEYNIITLKLSSCVVELGLPRVETFSSESNHKNFSFIHTYGYEKEFLRRDFTINAILFEFYRNEFNIIDPLDGYSDIKSKVLRPCSEDFVKDPVRMLRAYRFMISKGLALGHSLKKVLANMKLSGCSPYYILKEASKSKRPLSFFKCIGAISDFSELSIYNDNKYSNKIIFERDPSILDKESSMMKLGLGLKNVLLGSKNYKSIEDCLDLLKYFIRNKMTDLEIKYVLEYFNVPISCVRFEQFCDIDVNFNSKGMNVSEKDKYLLELILKEIKI